MDEYLRSELCSWHLYWKGMRAWELRDQGLKDFYFSSCWQWGQERGSFKVSRRWWSVFNHPRDFATAPNPKLKNRYWQRSCGFVSPALASLSLWPSFLAKSQVPQLDEIKWFYWEALKLAWLSMFSTWGHSLSREWRLFSLSLLQLLGIKSGSVCCKGSPSPDLTHSPTPTPSKSSHPDTRHGPQWKATPLHQRHIIMWLSIFLSHLIPLPFQSWG